MSEESNSETRPAGRSGPGCGLMLGMAILALLGMGAVGVEVSFAILGSLIFGWIAFLIRVLPQMNVNFSIAGMALLCGALVLGLGHVFLAWLNASIREARPDSGMRSWRWRWTGCGFASVCALFLVGMAAAGIAHQVAWIAGNPEPMAVPGRRVVSNSQLQNQRAFEKLFRGTVGIPGEDPDVAAAAEELRAELADWELGDGRRMVEVYQYFAILDEEGVYLGMLSFPRLRPAHRDWFGSLKVDSEEQVTISSEVELEAAIEKYRGRLLAL